MNLKLVCSGCGTELYSGELYSGELKKISDIMKSLDSGRPGSGLVYSSGTYSKFGWDVQNIYKCSKCNRVLEGPGRGQRRLADELERAKDILTSNPPYANEREHGNQQPDAESPVR